VPPQASPAPMDTTFSRLGVIAALLAIASAAVVVF
jgi:hypothetical protein